MTVTEPALAVKAADTLPAGTVTAGGTFNKVFDDDNETLAPPAGAACERVTVQGVDPRETSCVLVHVTDLIPFPFDATTAIAAPVPVVVIAVAVSEALIISDKAMGTVVPETVFASCTVAVATTPFAIVPALRPLMTHIVDPEVVSH